jgi:ribokinase
MQHKIVVVGSSNTDMVVKTEHFPQPGETIIGGDFFMFPGGKGANQAVAAARLNGSVTFIAKIGNDIFGNQALAGFKNENINTEFVYKQDNIASGVALITVNKYGENEIVVAPGANSQLNISDINNAAAAIKRADFLLTQLETPIETVVYSIKLAHEAGVKSILNPAPAQSLSKTVLNQLFLITPNETEASLLTGISVTNTDTAALAATELLNKGVQNVIITLGAQGAFYKSSKEHFFVSPPVVTAIDTTAAGDVFNGALVVALSEKLNWQEAIRFACNASALSVTRMGAQTSAPTRSELNIFDTK